MSQIDRTCPDSFGGGKDKASCSGLSSQHSDIRQEESPQNQLPEQLLLVFTSYIFFNEHSSTRMYKTPVLLAMLSDGVLKE